jgi:hypothetical protein
MRAGTLIVHTWNQPQVHVSSTQSVIAQHFTSNEVQGALRGGDIPIFSTSVQSPSGPITLPAEDFAVNSLAGGQHDGVTIFGGASGATVTLTVPADTALLWANVGRGRVEFQDYHAGSFVARVHNGSIQAQNAGGEGFMEVGRGPIQVANSSFDRLRARTAVGNISFEHCYARQIEVSSITGNVLYDDGSFAPGLARFESQQGNVALGVSGGGVQIGAHSGDGQIYQSFDRPSQIRGSANDAQAVVDGGGPVVTASSERGHVFLYNGSLKAHPDMRKRWQPVGRRRARPPATIQ